MILVTGGAGFIGANLCARLLASDHRVRILDNLSRGGADRNLHWLQQHPRARNLDFLKGNVADPAALTQALAGVQRIFHLAGQVAVTSSVLDPTADFEANAAGTFRLIETARRMTPDAVFVYASTNKVYGALESVEVVEGRTRYEIPQLPFGVPETAPLDFHSPYGCSKGAGDQYVRDYARIFGMRTVVLRQSCIYGPRQYGHADQGWLAWFVRAAIAGTPLTICGNGKQVRDVLFIDDLLDAYEAVVEHIDRTAGEAFNVGGGPASSVSLWPELAPLLEQLTGNRPEVSYADWRPGDQKVYISDIRKIQERVGWSPRTSLPDGLARFTAWLREELEEVRRRPALTS